MKLEVGMYIRVKELSEVIIVKVLKVTDDGFNADNNMFYEFSEVIKASYNIIDLIEVGDVVVDNSGRKLEVNLIRVWDNVKEIICNDYNLDDSAITLHNGGIFNVLTKEQFESNCYKIGDE